MTVFHVPWTVHFCDLYDMYSIGSSYLIRPSPSAEQYAGATVRICPRQGEKPLRTITLTAYRTQELIQSDDVGFLQQSALDSISQFEEDYGNLSDWDIEVFDFAYHPVDTTSRITSLAVYNALVSAFSAWTFRRSARTDRAWSNLYPQV